MKAGSGLFLKKIKKIVIIILQTTVKVQDNIFKLKLSRKILILIPILTMGAWFVFIEFSDNNLNKLESTVSSEELGLDIQSAANITNLLPEFKVAPLEIGGQIIEFNHTDENVGETLIIKSDKKVYNAFSESDVYFSITNTGNSPERTVILIYFSEKQGDVRKIDQRKRDNWDKLQLFRRNIKINSSALESALKKRSTIPEDFKVKVGTQIEIPAGQTAYLKSKIFYPPGSFGEFWIEAIGDKGGYGLLDPWYNSDWTYRRKITIDFNKVGSASDAFHSFFPVLVSSTLDDWKHTSFGGKVASGSGGDILFTESDGTTKIDHEIERYASSSGDLIAWVEVASLSATVDTVLYVYYGGSATGQGQENPTGTWNSNFVGVWHMDQDPSISTDGDCGGGTKEVCDSSSNDLDGDSSGGMTSDDSVAGQIGNAMDFDGGSTDEIIIGANSVLDTADVTVSIWVNGAAQTRFRYMVSKGANACQTASYAFETAGSVTTDDIEFYISPDGSDQHNTSLSLVLNSTWRYVVGVFDDTNNLIELYVDGSQISSTTETVSIDHTGTTNNDLGFGNYLGTCDLNFIGIIDEIKISNTGRSSDWIKTEYNSQSSPSTFYTLGAEETNSIQVENINSRGGTIIRGGVIFR